MIKAIFLDRDGTINVDTEYTHKIKDFEFEKNAVAGLKLLQADGFELVIATNQSGIAREYYAENDFWKFNDHVVSELKKNGVKILKTYFSPYHPEKGIGEYKKETNCRKPNSGMLEEAARDFEIDKGNSWIIGDKWADVKCGKNFKIKSILLLTGKAGSDQKHKSNADHIAKDMLDAAKYIIGFSKS